MAYVKLMLRQVGLITTSNLIVFCKTDCLQLILLMRYVNAKTSLLSYVSKYYQFHLVRNIKEDFDQEGVDSFGFNKSNCEGSEDGR